MPDSLTRHLIRTHSHAGDLTPDCEIRLNVDQTLTQDATGTLVMLELESMGLDRVRTKCSAQYVDHNLMQEDSRNADDHLFLFDMCRKLGVWYSRPGNGVSHPLHQQRFGVPGETMLGSDSHTPAAGAIGMLAIGVGGVDVALAMAGEPFRTRMPRVWGVRLTGALPEWVSAKDVILEMLRRHGVSGAQGHVIEYHGPGLDSLEVMDRHVIANMGTELGATSTVFPSDARTKAFLKSQGRAEDWRELRADPDCRYDREDEIDLSTLEPLIAMPSSPGNVELVHEVAGEPIYQAYIGSSANPGYRDFAVPAQMVEGKRVHERVSFDVNPTSRQLLTHLIHDGHLKSLIQSGARLHQAGCNGCIGMGQAPASGELSLRTVPRNFPGRSGTREDRVALVSPETATASALRGCVTDPRDLDTNGAHAFHISQPKIAATDAQNRMFSAPESEFDTDSITVRRGPNIRPLPELNPMPTTLNVPVKLKLGDDVSTDEILPAGTRVLPDRSNIPKISESSFHPIDPAYVQRAKEARKHGGHAVVAGANYGQGSSREHAALAPRYLGLRLVIALSFARIHHRNLINFGILPLTFVSREDLNQLVLGDEIRIANVIEQLSSNESVTANVMNGANFSIPLNHQLGEREIDMLHQGGVLNSMRTQLAAS